MDDNKKVEENKEDDSSLPQMNIEYRRDIEGCLDYIDGGILDNTSMRYDELSTALVDEEREMREEGFKKLNLPENEMLKTETSREQFPEVNKPAVTSVNIDKDAVKETLKTTGVGALEGAKNIFSRMKNFREQRQKERLEKEAAKSISAEKEGKSKKSSEFEPITDIKEVVKKEPNLKTIEEMKKPELAPYPIIAPKTAEVIQSNEEDNVEEEIKELKEIIEPNVNIPENVPEIKKDPFTSASPQPPKKPHADKESWAQKKKHAIIAATKQKSKQICSKVKESGLAKQILAISLGGAVVAISIVKRNSFRTFRTINDLKLVLKSPCKIHAAIQTVETNATAIQICQVPFPRYLIHSSISRAAEMAENSIPVSLLALNSNEQLQKIVSDLTAESQQKALAAKIQVLYYPSDVNASLEDNVVYGDVLIRGFGKNTFSRWKYHSLSEYLVRMGKCTIDRDINIDVNSETSKYMKKLSNDELYAVRRKLGIWEDRTSPMEDNFLMKAWFRIYRPFYMKYIYDRRVLKVTQKQ